MENRIDKKILYYIWLNSKLYAGSSAPKILLEHYKDIEKIYEASYDDYKALGIGNGDAAHLCDKTLDDAKRYYEYCAKEHIGVLCYDNPYYPGRLKCISDPPAMFYYKGKIEALDDNVCFAMVGTRSCSENGIRYSYRLGYKAAARGAVVVNGLAAGCDGAALAGALDADGYVVALLGSGIDRIYPPSNKELFKRVAAQGLILTEFPPFTEPESRNFPVRNRVISGMTLGTVVLEADARSGALITATRAFSQGKKIYALPGDIQDRLYEGPLQLIKDGAKPITDADDFVLEYALMFPHRINTKVKVSIPDTKENAFVEFAFAAYKIKKSEKAKNENALSNRKKDLKQKPKAKTESKDNRGNTDKNSFEKNSTLVTEVSKNQNAGTIPQKDYSALSVPEQAIMELFEKNETMSADEIASHGLKVDDVLSSLTMLETYGYLKALPGGRYEIADK